MAFSEPISHVLLKHSALAHGKDTKMHQVPCYAPEWGFISLPSDAICFQICVAETDCMTVRWAAFHRVKFADKLQLLLTVTAENCKYFSLGLWKLTTLLSSILVSLLCFCSLFHLFVSMHYLRMPLFLLGSKLYAQCHAFVFSYDPDHGSLMAHADNTVMVEGSLIFVPSLSDTLALLDSVRVDHAHYLNIFARACAVCGFIIFSPASCSLG